MNDDITPIVKKVQLVDKKVPTSKFLFPEMPKMYLELLENKDKIKQELVNTEFNPKNAIPPPPTEMKVPVSIRLDELLQSNPEYKQNLQLSDDETEMSPSEDDMNQSQNSDEQEEEEDDYEDEPQPSEEDYGQSHDEDEVEVQESKYDSQYEEEEEQNSPIPSTDSKYTYKVERKETNTFISDIPPPRKEKYSPYPYPKVNSQPQPQPIQNVLQQTEVKIQNVEDVDKYTEAQTYKNAYKEAYKEASKYKEAYKQVYKNPDKIDEAKSYKTAYKNAYENAERYKQAYKQVFQNPYQSPPKTQAVPPSLTELGMKETVIPNLNYMSSKDENEDMKRELLFKFDLLKKSYKEDDLPQFTIHSDYKTMKHAYDTTLKKMSISSSVENYKTYLIGGFMMVEYGLGNWLKFDMQGFTQQQIMSMGSYEKLLIELGEKSYVDEESQWPVEVRLLGLVVMNAAFFIISKMITKKTGSNILNMINSMNNSVNNVQNATRKKRPMKGPSINIDNLPDV